jgi:hypothetical protein
MKVKHFRWIFIAAFIALVILGYESELPTMGVSAEWTNARYHFAGGTAPWAFVYAAPFIGFYILLMYTPPSDQGQALPGVFRRFVAFWLDFILAMYALAPILGILPTITEWRRTGVFAWNFERTTSAPGDMLLASTGIVLSSVALLFYYAFPLILRKPSPGGCIVGYQIIPDEGTTLSFQKALLRTVLGFIAAAGACLAPFIARDRKNGKFWLDKIFDTRAVMLN